MSDACALDPLLARLYETTEDFAAWTPFLTSLCEATQTDNGALVIHNLRTDAVFTAFCHFDPAQVHRYRQAYARLNPWTAAVRDAGPALNPPGTVSLTEQIMPLDDLRQTSFYREWGLQNNVVHGVALHLGLEDGQFTYLSLSNGEKSGPIGTATTQLLTTLYPHIARAVRFQASRLRIESLLDVLDHASGAVFVFTSSGFLLEATRSAEALLEDGRLLRRDALNRLRPVHRTAQHQLDEALRQGSARYRTLPLGDGAWGVLTAVQHASLEPEFRRNQWMLTVPRADAGARSLELFAGQFGLTAAEIRLVRALLAHGSLTPAARALGVSRETAKTQLARVFARTRTNRQTEVIRLFSSLGVLLHA